MKLREVTVGAIVHCNSESIARVSGRYLSGRPAVVLLAPDGSRIAVATVNLPDHLQDGFVFLKGWGENEGIPEALEAAGAVRLTGRTVRTGYEYAQEAELLLEVPAS